MGLLHSRPLPQGRFKMLVNVSPDDVFWTTEHFVAKPGMVMQHQSVIMHYAARVSCRKIGSLCSVSRSQRGHIESKHDYFCCIFLTASRFATTLGFLVEQWDYFVQGQGHSKGSRCQQMFVKIIFSPCVWSCPLSVSWAAQPFFFNQT